jgi:uroporphyrinogen-III decarboxylase
MDKEFAIKNWERINKTIHHEEPDQVPVFLHINGPFVAKYNGIDPYQYYHDPALMLECQLKVRERFYNLTGVFPDLSMAVEPSALGAELKWTGDGTVWIIPHIKTLEDVEQLEIPNPETAGYMARALHTYRYMRKATGEGVPVSFNTVHSPWGVAALMRGTSQIMEDLILQPRLVKRLVEKTTDTVIHWLNKMKSEVPQGTFQRILVWDDLSSFVGPKYFRKFILPIYQKVFGSFPKAARWYHNDANATSILEGLADAGIECFHLGYEVDLSDAKRRIGDRVCLMGNVAPLTVLRNGTPREVMEACRVIIDKGAAGGGFILAAGGYIDEGTPAENIDTMIEAAEKYGKY